MNYINKILEQYSNFIPFILLSLSISFFLTPLLGYFIEKFNFIDLSAKIKNLDNKKFLSKINKEVALRGGGIAISSTIIFLSFFVFDFDKKIIAILGGLIILTIGGLYDDKYKSGKFAQLAPQVLASLIIIAAGISIDSIQSPFGSGLNLRMFTFQLFGEYGLAFPADLITLIWILMITHGINWVFGVNGLGEGVSIIALGAIFLISVKFQSPVPAMFAALGMGSTLGFFPYTAYPAKILSGTAGSNIFGFLIATLSILGGVKVSVAVIVMLIPLLDMMWVMIGRINRHGVKSILDVIPILTRGDHTHLHHRLLKLGFSIHQVTSIEWGAILVCAVVAFATADLPKMTIISIVGAVILLGFLLLSVLLKKGFKVKGNTPDEKDPTKSEETPESRYAY